MKHVSVGTEPQSLTAWKTAERVVDQRHYDGSLPTLVRDEIRHARVVDQGYLCPYTLRSIQALEPTAGDLQPRWDAHLEHFVARSDSRARANHHASLGDVAGQRAALEETVDYGNLLACVNRGADLPYGAATRGSQTLPVSPFQSDCETRFCFSPDGRIDAAPGAAGAAECIRILNLNHESLIGLRHAALYSRGLAPRRPNGSIRPRLAPKVPSPTAARQLAARIVHRDTAGRFDEFCLVIAQVATAFANTHS